MTLLAALLAAGCGGARGTSSPTPPTTKASAVATTTPPRPATERTVMDAWNGFWGDWVEVSKTADYDSPRLAEHATGKALRGLRLQLLSYRKRGLVARGTPVRTGTRVTEIRGGEARVSECLDSNRWLAHDARTGQVRGSPNGKTNQVEAALRLGGGRWKVSELTIKEAECAG